MRDRSFPTLLATGLWVLVALSVLQLMGCGPEESGDSASNGTPAAPPREVVDAPAEISEWNPRGGADPFGDEPTEVDPPVELEPSIQPVGADADAVDVTVYYATSRARGGFSMHNYKRAGWIGGIAFLLLALLSWKGPWWFRNRWKWSPTSVRTVCWTLFAMAAIWQIHGMYGDWQRVERWGFMYNGERRIAKQGEARYTSDLGKVAVSVPTRRASGTMIKEKWWRGEFVADPVKHFILSTITPQEKGEYYGEVRSRVTSDPSKSAFIFVHGYNTTFEHAAMRTAQIAHDLQFKGAPIFYSWPSDAIETAYFVDRDDADWGTGHFREFLRSVRDETGAEIIHLVAHSMGTRVLCNALRDLEPSPEGPEFDSIILAAPDIDADYFENEIAPKLSRRGKMITLYASTNDDMIKLSNEFNGNRRAGDAANLAFYKGYTSVDSVDVSKISQGHSYMGNNGRVLSDVRAQLIHRLPANKRPGLRWVNDPPHWILEELK